MARIQSTGSSSSMSRWAAFNGFHGMALILALAAVLAWLSYQIVGVKIDQNNVLQEAFYLIPLGYLAAFLSLGCLLLAEWRRMRRR